MDERDAQIIRDDRPPWMTYYSDLSAQHYADDAQLKLWLWLNENRMIGASVIKQQIEWMGRSKRE